MRTMANTGQIFLSIYLIFTNSPFSCDIYLCCLCVYKIRFKQRVVFAISFVFLKFEWSLQHFGGKHYLNSKKGSIGLNWPWSLYPGRSNNLRRLLNLKIWITKSNFQWRVKVPIELSIIGILGIKVNFPKYWLNYQIWGDKLNVSI